nr:hypothetical protein [Halorubrum sp. BOL3-1]
MIKESDRSVHDVRGRKSIKEDRSERNADVPGEQTCKPVDDVAETDRGDDREPRGDRGGGVWPADQHGHPPVRRVRERPCARGPAHIGEQSQIEDAVGASGQSLLPVAEKVRVVRRRDDEPVAKHRGCRDEPGGGDREQSSDQCGERGRVGGGKRDRAVCRRIVHSGR